MRINLGNLRYHLKRTEEKRRIDILDIGKGLFFFCKYRNITIKVIMVE